MSISRKLPEIEVLLQRVEHKSGFKPAVHDKFELLAGLIFNDRKEYISPTTLERLWGYSTRKCDNVSLRTLDLLSSFIGCENWASFRQSLKTEGGAESDLFDQPCVHTKSLKLGDRLIVGWQPNRLCEIEYLGDNQFRALKATNSKLKVGDMFVCTLFQLGSPLFMENVRSADGTSVAPRYGVGLRNGLTTLQIVK